jgi:anti-sigma regulatory factor (Ser/Thr protein kinase)
MDFPDIGMPQTTRLDLRRRVARLNHRRSGNSCLMAAGSDQSSQCQTVALPNDVDAPALARSYLCEHAGWLTPDLMDDALVLVSELVTNAVSHGEPEITLRVRREPPGIGVEVDDAGTDLPRIARPKPHGLATSGRGLQIVEAIADDWGVILHRSTPGKTVWFELQPHQDRSVVN